MERDSTERIPDEVLAHIFSHLNPIGKVTASSVCKRWMKIINDGPDLLDNVCVHFFGRNQTYTLGIFSTMIRNFCCFCFEDVVIDLKIFNFLKKFGPQFRSLSFEHNQVTLDLKDPIHKISNLFNLLELKILFSPVHGMFTSLPKLKSLHINVTNRFVQRDMPFVARINTISLTDLKIDGLHTMDLIGIPMDRMYTAVKRYIEKQRSTLRSLEITGMPILDENMAHILEIEGLRLKRLKLPRYFSREKTFQTLCTTQQRIVALDLENVHLEDDSMIMICNALPQMEELNVSQCALINTSVVQIFQLKCLRKLDLSGCRDIKNESFLNALETLACIKLKVLHLKYLNIDCSILSSIMSLLPNLKKITVDAGYNLDSSWVKCFENVPIKTQAFLYRPNM